MESTPLVVAHRGGRHEGLRGEQTAEHFERAITLGADFIEVDLRRTADGRLVCVHDPGYAGVTVAQTSYADLAQAAERAGEPVPPLLGELFTVSSGRVRLDLEIKVRGIEAQALDEVRRDADLDTVVFKSFYDEVVRTLKTLEPRCTAGLLLGVEKPSRGVITRLGEVFPHRRLRACGADFVAPHYRLLILGFVRRMKRLGIPIWAWTVNEPALIREMLGRVDAIITDDPATCLRLRRGE